MSNFIFVLDTNKKPLTPCKPSMAHKLLTAGKAAVFRRFPFTIILKKAVTATIESTTLKLDPGSKTTGIALLHGEKVIFGAELTHRGQLIKASLDSRRSLRRSRRNRHTRYRQARFLNRTRKKGWLAPSLNHRVETTLTWVNKLRRLDAACVGQIESLSVLTNQPLLIKATGHGTRQMCRTDKFGFPSRYVPRNKFVKGFQTGDIVKAVVTSGKKIGEYVGRVAVRTTGSFNISASELVQGISYKCCKIVHKKDGYGYTF
ncbi:MAG: RNA-guided endonuclease IscB [Microcoleus sp.]